MPVGREKKFFFFFHFKCLCLLQNKHLEPFLNTGCWVGVRVSQIPSILLLVFLPKVGNESGQASYSRISSDCLSQEGGWNFKIQISSKFPEGYNLGLSLMYFQIWYYHSFVTNWKLSMGMYHGRGWWVGWKGTCQESALGPQDPAILGHCGLD